MVQLAHGGRSSESVMQSRSIQSNLSALNSRAQFTRLKQSRAIWYHVDCENENENDNFI